MMRRLGRVTALDGEYATVAVSTRCNACSGDTCALSWNTRKHAVVAVPRRPGWQLGQKVAIDADPGLMLTMAGVGYGLPLLGFWVGLLLGMPWGDLIAAGLALSGLLVALTLGRRYDARKQLCASIRPS